GDARYLPFRECSTDLVFSYSVLQHLSRDDVGMAVDQFRRVLKDGGSTFLQFPTVFGIRSLYHQLRRGFGKPTGFEVRYWTIPALRSLFSKSIGPPTLSVDCYFGIGLQQSDWELMTPTLKVVLTLSESLRSVSLFAPFMKYVADSVYVSASKSPALTRL